MLKRTPEKIVTAAYKFAALERGEEVEFYGSFWRLVDQADYFHKEHKRGRKVLIERRIDGKTEVHARYQWSTDEVQDAIPDS